MGILHVIITEVRRSHKKASKVSTIKYTSIFLHMRLSGPGSGKYNLFCFRDTLRSKGVLPVIPVLCSKVGCEFTCPHSQS